MSAVYQVDLPLATDAFFTRPLISGRGVRARRGWWVPPPNSYPSQVATLAPSGRSSVGTTLANGSPHHRRSS